VKLGPISFQEFEVPSNITFGGKQITVEHRLCGGRRLIDTLGPDSADIALSGAFSGADALQRAQDLDLLRKNGAPVVLSWGSFYCSVIVTRFLATYQNPVWIPYSAICTVVQDNSNGLSYDYSDDRDSLVPPMLISARTLFKSNSSTSKLSTRLGLPDDGLANRPQAIADTNVIIQIRDDIATRLETAKLQVANMAASQDTSLHGLITTLADAENIAKAMSELIYIRSYLSGAIPSVEDTPYA
jgi:hypothetical protein